MFKSFSTALVFASIAAGLVNAQAIINTPQSLTVCQPSALTFTGGVAPYFVSVIHGGDPTSAAYVQFDPTSDNTITWTVDLPAGTSISLAIKDSTGAINYSQAVTIQAGTSTACLNAAAAGSSSSSGSAAAATSTTSGAAAATTTTTGAVKSTTTGSASATTTTTKGSASTTTTGTSAAAATTTAADSASGRVMASGVALALTALVGSLLF